METVKPLLIREKVSTKSQKNDQVLYRDGCYCHLLVHYYLCLGQRWNITQIHSVTIPSANELHFLAGGWDAQLKTLMIERIIFCKHYAKEASTSHMLVAMSQETLCQPSWWSCRWRTLARCGKLTNWVLFASNDISSDLDKLNIDSRKMDQGCITRIK